MDTILLTLSCADRVGLRAETTGFCAGRGLNLLDAHQFTDAANGWFSPGSKCSRPRPFQLQRDGLLWMKAAISRCSAGRTRSLFIVEKVDLAQGQAGGWCAPGELVRVIRELGGCRL